MAPEFLPFILVTLLAIGVLFGAGTLIVSLIIARFSKRHRRIAKMTSVISGVASMIAGGLLWLLGSSVHEQYFLNEPMVTAASQGKIEEVRDFLDRGASPDAYGIDYIETALIAAVKSDREDTVILLLSRGANPELRDYRGEIALDHAEKMKNRGIADLLREAAAKRSP